MDVDALVITKSWMTCNASDKNILCESIWIHHSQESWRSWHSFLRESLKYETHLNLQAKSFENIKVVEGCVCVCVCVCMR